MHDQKTGEFQPLSDQLVQIEAGFAGCYLPSAEIAKQIDRFLPVAWVWRDGMSIASAVCEMASDDELDPPKPPLTYVSHAELTVFNLSPGFKELAPKLTGEQNLWWAVGYNVFAFPLTAGALYPFTLSP